MLYYTTQYIITGKILTLKDTNKIKDKNSKSNKKNSYNSSFNTVYFGTFLASPGLKAW